MKAVILLFIAMALAGCNQSKTEAKVEKEVETLLVCEGSATSMIAGLGGKQQTTFVITKMGDKIIRVKSQYNTYALDKVDVNTKENRGPVYIQLIVEADKVILRTEITEDKRKMETVIFTTGAYKQDQAFGWSEGQCTVSEKAF